MAYSDWAPTVICNGTRREDREDQTPYREGVFASGVMQIHMAADGANPVHADLGDGRVRLCAFKDAAFLYLANEEVPLEAFEISHATADSDPRVYSGEIAGCLFHAVVTPRRSVTLELREPEGAVWTATSLNQRPVMRPLRRL